MSGETTTGALPDDVQLLPGDRVSVQEAEHEAPFTGDLVEILPPTSARLETRYRIRRTVTVVVNGFHRNEYWATRKQLTLIARSTPGTSGPSAEYLDADARR